MPSMSIMCLVLVVVALLMLLQLWFYYYGVNTNGVTVINSVTMVRYLNIFHIYSGLEDKYWDSTITKNCENEEIAKILFYLYEVNSFGLLLHFRKTWYPGEVKSIGDDKIEFLCVKRIGRASDSFVWPENKGLVWFTYYEILCYCVVNPQVPETWRAFVMSRQDLDEIYQFMLQHWD